MGYNDTEQGPRAIDAGGFILHGRVPDAGMAGCASSPLQIKAAAVRRGPRARSPRRE
ncbi:hypothetical protein HPP92_003882 [Vanilla planifolia]|uniref:Uncharacterized protein n=1 Tax=Vanilla planifolia TaxID=51239 RepID=A0A835S3U5_VANPL|nr:hypothetical protein HPP92_003882 [Vanilla planifolia]